MLREAIVQLEQNGKTIVGFLEGMTDEEAVWRPAGGKWCALEIINHLLDEENEDFRKRLDLTLRHPERPWPSIDPEGWVVTRGYESKDMAGSLTDFLQQREGSVVWLRSLKDPDFSRAHDHPKLGTITAGSILASWVAHDLLHIKQIAKLKYERMAAIAAPHDAGYAGPWE